MKSRKRPVAPHAYQQWCTYHRLKTPPWSRTFENQQPSPDQFEDLPLVVPISSGSPRRCCRPTTRPRTPPRPRTPSRPRSPSRTARRRACWAPRVKGHQRTPPRPARPLLLRRPPPPNSSPPARSVSMYVRMPCRTYTTMSYLYMLKDDSGI